MSDIYYGRVDHPWAIDIESWPEQPAKEVDRLQGYQASINQHVASLGWPENKPTPEQHNNATTKNSEDTKK